VKEFSNSFPDGYIQIRPKKYYLFDLLLFGNNACKDLVCSQVFNLPASRNDLPKVFDLIPGHRLRVFQMASDIMASVRYVRGRSFQNS
jgi:hypothetical protein